MHPLALINAKEVVNAFGDRLGRHRSEAAPSLWRTATPQRKHTKRLIAGTVAAALAAGTTAVFAPTASAMPLGAYATAGTDSGPDWPSCAALRAVYGAEFDPHVCLDRFMVR